MNEKDFHAQLIDQLRQAARDHVQANRDSEAALKALVDAGDRREKATQRLDAYRDVLCFEGMTTEDIDRLIRAAEGGVSDEEQEVFA